MTDLVPRAENHRLGLALVSLSAVVWSLAGLFTRIIELDVWTVLLWRSLFTAIGILALMLALGRLRLWRIGWPGLAYAVVSAAGMVFYITSLKLTSVAHNAVIYATAPFVTSLLAFIVLREVPRRSAIIAACIALAGVAVMAGFGSDGTVTGDALALAMTLCLAAMMVISRRHPEMPALEAGWASALLSALIVLPLASPLAPAGLDWGWLAAFGLINSALGLGLFTIGARYLAPAETALVSSLDAPLAPFWVWLVFAETPGPATLLGGAIVFTAVLGHIV